VATHRHATTSADTTGDSTAPRLLLQETQPVAKKYSAYDRELVFYEAVRYFLQKLEPVISPS